MRKAIATIALIAAGTLGQLAYTKHVWQSGFDQGADVALCVVASMQNDGKLDMSALSCRSAKDYEDNPLWALRRSAPR